MTYIITMRSGRQYVIEDYDDQKYGDNWLRFYDDSGDVVDRFAVANIEHVDVQGRGKANLIGRANTNAT